MLKENLLWAGVRMYPVKFTMPDTFRLALYTGGTRQEFIQYIYADSDPVELPSDFYLAGVELNSNNGYYKWVPIRSYSVEYNGCYLSSSIGAPLDEIKARVHCNIIPYNTSMKSTVIGIPSCRIKIQNNSNSAVSVSEYNLVQTIEVPAKSIGVITVDCYKYSGYSMGYILLIKSDTAITCKNFEEAAPLPFDIEQVSETIINCMPNGLQQTVNAYNYYGEEDIKLIIE